MQKKGKESARLARPSPGAVLLLTPLVLLVCLWNREPGYVQLKYGELIQILNASRHGHGVTLQKVQVNRGDIRGEIVTSDRASGEGVNGKHSQTISFRTPRVGLEEDAGSARAAQGSGRCRLPGGRGRVRLQDHRRQSAVDSVRGRPRRRSGADDPLDVGRRLAAHLRPQPGTSSTPRRTSKITFEDVAGIDEAVAELREVVDFLKTPEKYQALGGRIPKGVLLVGPPGTGKTLLAKAVAGEADVPFFSLCGSDFVEMFVGVGAARVRDLFGQAESQAPCIIFIDELDALGKTRGGSAVGGHDEREQTLNQLLVEMDGFDSNRGVIIMAATNRPETLDPALLRPGRFDRTVVVDRPDIVGREAILKVHVRNVKLGRRRRPAPRRQPDARLGRRRPGEPGQRGGAAGGPQRARTRSTMADFNEAVERGAVGLERKSRIMHADEKQRVAYHEAGHALVACSLPNTDPVHKVSIIPRGVGALGYVLQRPEDDRYLMTQSRAGKPDQGGPGRHAGRGDRSTARSPTARPATWSRPARSPAAWSRSSA